ncbi:MAG: type II toxin-antitoxin system HicA family toxin [Candidatus Acidiferrales bacterium]
MTKLPNISGASRHSRIGARWLCCSSAEGEPCLPEKITAERTVKTVVPQHSSLDKGTLSRILKQAGLTIEQFLELL